MINQDKFEEILLEHERWLLYSFGPNDNNFKKANFSEQDLTLIVRQNAELQSSNFKSAILKDVDLSFGNFYNAEFSGANLSGANLQSCNFERANLQNVNFSEANLLHSHFFKANLSGVNFTGAIMEGIYLVGADLTNAILPEIELNLGCLYTVSNEYFIEFEENDIYCLTSIHQNGTFDLLPIKGSSLQKELPNWLKYSLNPVK